MSDEPLAPLSALPSSAPSPELPEPASTSVPVVVHVHVGPLLWLVVACAALSAMVAVLVTVAA